MAMLDLDAFARTPLSRDPFDHVIVPGFLAGDGLAAVEADYPAVPGPGSYPTSELSIKPGFQALLSALEGPEFRDAMQAKFAMDLRGRPTMVTVRGHCQLKDGRIHTDSKTKLITVLLYVNASWNEDAGRLRLLRSKDDLDDYAAEVPPDAGTLLAFRRSDHSWHGHKPFAGARRAIQLNWVTDAGVVEREQGRHRFSATVKRALGWH